jgi:hypothetical protein
VACWQATDKALENSRLFGGTPGRSLSLASTGGILPKRVLATVMKVINLKICLNFQYENDVGKAIFDKMGEGIGKKKKKFVKLSLKKRRTEQAAARTLTFA